MGIRIKEISYYHPENKVTNDYFIRKYLFQDMDIRGLLESSGRNERYVSKNKEETMLTMAISVAKDVLSKASLKGSDIDAVICASGTPEYLLPTNAIKIHNAIDGKSSAVVYDINSNCLGMLVALDQIRKVMKYDNTIKYALIIGSQQLQRYSRDDEPVVDAIFGDAACAILVEKSEVDISYVIDSLYFTDSDMHTDVHFPANGLSNALGIRSDHSTVEDRTVHWGNSDGDRAFASAVSSIKELLRKNSVNPDEVKVYCVSQMMKSKIDMIQKELNQPSFKFPYIGDIMGYTGVTSPFLALANALENRKLQRGDYVVLWSVGSGITTTAILLRY